MDSLKIGKSEVGEGKPVFIIAEIGINHEGNVKQCAQMIKAAADSGVDAVKLQTIDADANYVRGSDSYKVFKGSELSIDETKEMFDLARSLGIEIFTTAGDVNTVKWVDELDPCAWKISSGLLNHLPLIDKISKLGKPVLISTGLSDFDEIEDAVNTLYKNGNYQIGLFQCTSIYPVKYKNIYLSRIVELKRRFNVQIGFSDHSLGNDASFLSVGVGASMIEKHFTYDKNRKGYDHAISMNKQEMEELVKRVRTAEIMIGNGNVRFKELQKEKRKTYLRCIVAKQTIMKGELFTKENVAIKRPLPNQRGLDPKYYSLIINKQSSHSFIPDEPITDDILEL